MNGLQGLRFDAVIRRHHQHHHVRDLCAPRSHGGKGFVAGGIQKGDGRIVDFDLIGADVLGDASGFVFGDPGFADRVQQRGFSVIDMSHDGDNGRAGHVVFRQILFRFFFKPQFQFGSDHFNFKSPEVGDLRRHLQAQGLIDRGHDSQPHQFHDNIVGVAF